MAFLRFDKDYRNLLLVEQPNTDFGFTMMRQFLFDAYRKPLFEALMKSNNTQLAAIAEKSLKETKYHLRHSSEWIIRLGDGTEESHWKIQDALNDIWSYRHELFEKDEVDETLIEAGLIPDTVTFKAAFEATIQDVLDRATIEELEEGWKATGGRKGHHSEYLGHILPIFQSIPRTYPESKW